MQRAQRRYEQRARPRASLSVLPRHPRCAVLLDGDGGGSHRRGRIVADERDMAVSEKYPFARAVSFGRASRRHCVARWRRRLRTLSPPPLGLGSSTYLRASPTVGDSHPLRLRRDPRRAYACARARMRARSPSVVCRGVCARARVCVECTLPADVCVYACTICMRAGSERGEYGGRAGREGGQGAEENRAERGPSTTPRRCWGRTRRLLGTGMSSDTENTETTHVLAGHHPSVSSVCVITPSLALPPCLAILSFVVVALSLYLRSILLFVSVSLHLSLVFSRTLVQCVRRSRSSVEDTLSRCVVNDVSANSIMCVRDIRGPGRSVAHHVPRRLRSPMGDTFPDDEAAC